MKWTKRNLKIFLSAFFAFLLALLVATSCSAEQTYRITEQELTQLETNLAQLKSNNESKDKELQKLLIQLSELRVLQQQTQLSLDNANKSLEEYGKEVKAKECRIKRQRNFAYVLFVGTLYFVVKK